MLVVLTCLAYKSYLNRYLFSSGKAMTGWDVETNTPKIRHHAVEVIQVVSHKNQKHPKPQKIKMDASSNAKHIVSSNYFICIRQQNELFQIESKKI